MYDAEIGRFLSADPFVDDSTNLQALNRYSYVQNNPLSYTDPSGYFLKKLVSKIVGAVKSAVSEVVQFERELRRKILRSLGKVEGLSTVISLALNFVPGCAGWCSMAFNAAMADANGGTIAQMLAGAAVGFIASGFDAALTNIFGNGDFAQFGIALFMGGATSKAQGGKFIDGVKGAVITFGLRRIVKAVKEPTAISDPGQSTEAAHSGSKSGSSTGIVLNMALNVAGKIWNLPNTIIGMAYGGIGHAIGKVGYWAGLLPNNPNINWFRNNAIAEFENNPFAKLGAITLGNTIVYGGSRYDLGADGNPMWIHERQHTLQSEKLGPLYLPSNIIGGAVGVITGGAWHADGNWNERGPQEHPPKPW